MPPVPRFDIARNNLTCVREGKDYVRARDYDALMAEYMALSQDDGKVERALESAQKRIKKLENAFATLGAKVYGGQWVDHGTNCEFGSCDESKCTCGLLEWLMEWHRELGLSFWNPRAGL